MGPVMTTTGHAAVRRLLAGALTGVLTAAVALGVAELAAAIIGPNSAPVIAVGDTAINLTPIPVKEFAIAHFGSHDKQALLSGIVVLLLAFAVGIGIAAVRRIGYGLAGLAVFAVIGAAAAIHLPGATFTDVIPTLAGVVVAAGTLIALVRAVWVRAVPGGARGRSRRRGRVRTWRLPGAGREQAGPSPLPGCGGGSGGGGGGGRRRRRQTARTVQRRLVPGPGPAARPGRPGGGRPRRDLPDRPRADPVLTPTTPASTGSTPTWCCRRCRRPAGH